MAKGERSGKHSKVTTKGKFVDEEELWMSKEQLILSLGPKKTQALIDHGNLTHRPCKRTGLDDEFSREYLNEFDKVVHRGTETTSKEAGQIQKPGHFLEGLVQAFQALALEGS